jgi:hypothetical protein
MKANAVFTPGAFPQHTYVERTGEQLEQQLRDAIDTPGLIVSLSGPSKSGKTVLVEKVVGKDLLIPITGAGIRSPDDVWRRALDWMGVPASEVTTLATAGKIGAEVTVGGHTSLFGLVEGSAEGKGNLELSREREKARTQERAGLAQVVKEIGGSDFVVLIDDFHYMRRDVQGETAKSLKEAVRLGVKICTAAVRHRGDDLVRANPELRGRVRAVDLHYWNPIDLQRIATSGFNELNADIDNDVVRRLVQESAGSPQLMQLLCLETCNVTEHRSRCQDRRSIILDSVRIKAVFERASGTTDFRSLVDVLDTGPKTRGTERKTYRFCDGTEGDVYRCVLKAIASDPPQLSFEYDKLLGRTIRICKDDPPVGSSVIGTCLHMSKLAVEKFPDERAIDWDEQKQILDVPDPYLLFYLRWSGRLNESE